MHRSRLTVTERIHAVVVLLPPLSLLLLGGPVRPEYAVRAFVAFLAVLVMLYLLRNDLETGWDLLRKPGCTVFGFLSLAGLGVALALYCVVAVGMT